MHPSGSRGLPFAGLVGDRGLAGVGGERVAGGVALAAVADLGKQLRGGDHAAGDLNSERKISPSGCARTWVRDLALELLDLGIQRPDHRDQAEHELSAGGELELADPRAWSAAQLGHQRRRMLSARIPLAHKKPCIRATPSPWASAGLG